MQYVEIEPTEAQTKESCDFFLGKNIGLTISLLEGTKISIQKIITSLKQYWMMRNLLQI